MKTAEQARQEVDSRKENRKSRKEALVLKAKNIGSGNELFLVLSIIYSAIDLEIELEKSRLNVSDMMDVSKINKETLEIVVEALRKNGYNVIYNPKAPLDLRLYISW